METGGPVLYTQEACADSAKVRAWLTAHRIAFTEHDVTHDVATARDLAATGVFATPLLVAGTERVFGFRPDRLRAVLGVVESDE